MYKYDLTETVGRISVLGCMGTSYGNININEDSTSGLTGLFFYHQYQRSQIFGRCINSTNGKKVQEN